MLDNPERWLNKKVKVPSILQMEAVECGAASLGMIFAHYGKFMPLEQLRIECGVSRDGSKASNMLKAARKFGFTAKGYSGEPDRVHNFPLPQIIFWNFNHFVVLKGVVGDKVYLNDPATGPKVVSKEEFDQAFTGIILTFSPGPDFEKGGEKSSIVPALASRLKGVRTALIFAVLAGLFLVVPGLVIPIFSKIFVDNILVNNMHGWIRPLLVAMGITAILRGILTWFQQRYLLRMETKLALASSAKFFRHVFRLPIDFFYQRNAGEIANRVQLNDQVAQLLSGELATNIINVIMIIFYAFLMLQYDVLLTSIGVFIVVLNLVVLKYVSTLRTNLNQKFLQENGKLIGISMSGLQMIETLKATGSETEFFGNWSGYQSKVLNAQQEIGATTRLLMAMPAFLRSLNDVVILTLGGLRVMEGHMSMGMLIAFQSLMRSFIAPVDQMVNLGSRIQETTGNMKKLDDVLKHEPDEIFELDEDDGQGLEGYDKVKLDGYLKLEDISFGYNILEPPLIENFNLELRPGDRIALVGGTGSGKSTVAKIITGLYRPWSGTMYLDGEPISTYPREIIINSLASVDQEIFLFEGTVRENITMWDKTIPDGQVIQAARDACIHYDIAARPGGYESKVDENGGNFSGGQRQRLEIARSLANNPKLLVLDEATSALDTKVEAEIDKTIRRRGCTTVIIAHRLSTIRDCDEIIVLDHGKIVQRGTHDELIDQEGLYANLVKTM